MCNEREVKNDGRKKSLGALLKDPQRSYDAQCKKILSLKKILAYLYKECLSEYRHLSLKEINY